MSHLFIVYIEYQIGLTYEIDISNFIEIRKRKEL